MKVIGAGFPRTGTMSLRQALQILGYPCYHMEAVAENYKKGHVKLWDDHIHGRAEMDWDLLFAEYEATTDFPAAWFYKDIMGKYPDAKIILSIRDGESWYKSLMKLKKTMDFIQKLRFIPFVREVSKIAFYHPDSIFGGDWSRENLISIYDKHNEEVKSTVPADKLLIFEAKDGWEPLCTFLGKPIPNIPYPHSNSGNKTINQKFSYYIRKNLLRK